MKYLITHLTQTSSADNAQATRYGNAPALLCEEVDGSLEITGEIAIIYEYGTSKLIDPDTGMGSPTKKPIFSAHLKNVTIIALKDT